MYMGPVAWITDDLALQRTPLTLFETRAPPYLVTGEVHPEHFWRGAVSEF